MPPRGGPPMKPRGGGHGPVRRPRTSPGLSLTGSRRVSVQQAVTAEDEALAEDEDGEDQIELLEYEWPDLPPIPCMKDAVSRRRVSQGISYLLPVDKGRNSINNKFRTDLRAMFQEPYASDDLQYDDNRVKLSAKVHFLSNTADTKWTREHLRSIPTHLNADCEGARKLYVHSAPAGGAASRRMGIDPNKLRKRSNLFLPVKASTAQVSPEIIKLREEAAEIIRQGLAYQDGDDVPQDSGGGATKEADNVVNGLFNRRESEGPQATRQRHDSSQQQARHQSSSNLLATVGSGLGDSYGTSTLQKKLQSVVTLAQEKPHFRDYETLKATPPPKAVIPPVLRSTFMSPEENQRIWDWMHKGETMSDFDYFLSVCG